MPNTLKIKRGTNATIPQGQLAEPLFTTDTYDLYIGKGSGGNQRIQNYIASGTSSQFLKGDGSLDSTTYQATSEKGQNNGYASLDSGGKVPVAQLPNSIMEYKGTWDASTNTPTLADGTGNAGDVYIVSVGGTQNLGSGSITFAAGDWVVYSGTVWQKSINSNAVASVNGQTGVVVLTTTNISEGTNLYYTDTRARAAITLTTTSSSGAATYTSGTLNIPNYTLAGLGGQPQLNGTGFVKATGTTISYDNSTYLTTSAAASTYLALTGGSISATSAGYALSITNIEDSSQGLLLRSTDADTTLYLARFQSSASAVSQTWVDRFSIAKNGSTVIGDNAPFVNIRLYVKGSSTSSSDYALNIADTNGSDIAWFRNDKAIRFYGDLTGIGATFSGNISAANLSGTNTGDQTLSGLGGVPTTRTLTINGTTYDLSANRTWSVGTIGGSGTSGYVPKFTASTTIGNSLIYDNGVRAVSIGNSSTNSWASPFYVIEGGTYGQFIGFQTNNPAFKLGTNAYFNGSNYIYTNTGYGVGILDVGSDATNAYLDFYGAPTGTAGNAATISKKFSIDNTGNAYFVESLGVGFTTGTINGRIDFRNPGNAIIVGKNTTGGTNTYSSIRLTTANSGGVGDSIGEIRGLSTNSSNRDIALTFLTSEGSAGQTEKFRIAANGAATFSANVGLGSTFTNSAGYTRLLNVYDASSAAVGISIASNDYQLGVESDGGFRIRYNGTQRFLMSNSGTATFSNSVTAENGFYSRSGNGVYVSNAANTRTGYLITTADGTELSSHNGSGEPLLLKAPDTTATIRFIVNGTNVTGERMRITSGGNVGIGVDPTGNSNRILHVNGADSAELHLTRSNSGTSSSFGGYITFDGSNNFNIQNRTGGDIIFTTTTSERMRITSAGDMYLTGRSTNGDYGMYFYSNDTDSRIYSSNSGAVSKSLMFYTSGTERMRITSGGNVGIGTTPSGGDGNFETVGFAGTITASVKRVASFYCTSAENADKPGVILGYDTNGAGVIAARTNSAGQPLAFWTYTGLAWGERMRITTNGNINFNDTVYNNTAVATTRTLYIGSDYRIGGISSIRASKKNIKNISNIDWLYQLNPVTFNYRKKNNDNTYTDEVYNELCYGLIAEDTAPIADFLINYNNKEDGTKEMIGIEYSRLITPLLKAIQEQQAQIEELKSKLN